MGLWTNVNHGILEKHKDAGVSCFILPVMSHGKCRQAVTISHAEAEFKQALRILETGEYSDWDPSVEGEPP